MPSARRSGLASLLRSCDRKTMKPSATAATNASGSTTNARGRRRGAREDAFGDLSSDCVVMRDQKTLPRPIVESFSGEVESGEATDGPKPSFNVIKGGEQRAARGPGGDCRNHERLRRQHQIAGRAQRKRAEQRGKLVADRRAGEPSGN